MLTIWGLVTDEHACIADLLNVIERSTWLALNVFRETRYPLTEHSYFNFMTKNQDISIPYRGYVLILGVRRFRNVQ